MNKKAKINVHEARGNVDEMEEESIETLYDKKGMLLKSELCAEGGRISDRCALRQNMW